MSVARGTDPRMALNAAAGAYGPEGARLLQLVADLGIAHGFERSFKIKRGELLAERFLLTLHKRGLGSNPLSTILSLCDQLNAPIIFANSIKNNIAFSNIVHFGFEKNHDSIIYKFYLEFFKPSKTDDRSGARDLVYLSFKWDMVRPDKHSVARYTALPPLALSELISHLSKMYDFKEKSGFFKMISRLLEHAASRIPGRRLFVLDVAEENNRRRSFDVNLYDANLRVEDVGSMLWETWKYFDVSDDKLAAFYESIKGESLGHYSAGKDRSGNEFATVFFGVKEGRDRNI